MNKLFKTTLALLVASLFIGMSFAKADFTVTVGTVTTYDVNDSSWNFVDGEKSSSGTGFNFEGTKFAEGTQVTVTVDSVTDIIVAYDVSVGTKSATRVSSPFALLGIVIMLFYPLMLSSAISIYWDQTEYDLGPYLWELFYVDPTLANIMFYELTNETFLSSLSVLTDDVMTFNEIGGTFKNDTDVAIFTWTFDILFVNTTANTDFSGKYSLTFAYDQITGEVMGYRLDSDFAGTFAGSHLEVNLYQEVEILGYNLPGGAGFIGFEWFVVIPALVFVGSLGAVIRKRKQ